MKKIITLLTIVFIPFLVFGDVLPEPDIFGDNDTEIIENFDPEWGNLNSEDGINSVEIDEDMDENIDENMGEDTDDDILNNWTNNIDSDDEILEEEENNNASLASIWFWFCNEWYDNLSSSLNYAISIWQPFKICVVFYNKSQQDITIEVRMVDTTLNADWLLSCAYWSTNILNFIKKSDLDELKEITLPAWEYITKEFDITFPVWLEWDQTYCFTYHIPSLESSDAMISTVINKYSFMKFFVWGIDDLKNEIEIKNIETFLDDNKDLNLKFLLSNVWNLENKIEINGTISNIFWFKKPFSLYWNWMQLIAGWESMVSAILWSIPSYGGRFKIEFTATATPFFSYDVSNSNIDTSLLETKEFTASTTFFQMPRLILIILIILILLIITIFRKPKEKVVYVQAPQQPMPNPWYQQPQYTQPQYQNPQNPQIQQPVQPQQQYPNNPQYGQQVPQNPQPTPPQYNPNN